MSINDISVVIIAKNAQDTIKECLISLQRFDEVVLYLNNSTDNTKEIALNFPNVKIHEGKFIGFGPTKNKAATYARNNWILSLDSDEILNENIVDELITHDLDEIRNIFILKRENYFLGYKTISKDFIARVYNKKHTSFNQNAVHEKVIIHDNSVRIILKNSFKHLNITDINQTLTKMIKYTDLGAQNEKTCFFIIVLIKPVFAFIQAYFLRLYFLNGWIGFTIAISNANRRFYKYLKRYINCKEKRS